MPSTPRPTHWSTPPARPMALEGAVELWLADLDGPGIALDELLCGAEHERARHIRGVLTRRRWKASRGILRSLLARHLDCDPRRLSFALGEMGKPMIQIDRHARARMRARGVPFSKTQRPPLDTYLHFNLSHSGPTALYSLSSTYPVGIDVERRRDRIDELAIAARVFGREQAQRLAAMEAQTRRNGFLQAWTSHEAAVKCRGQGLGRASSENADGLWLTELDVGPQAAAALAVDGPAPQLRCWQWQG